MGLVAYCFLAVVDAVTEWIWTDDGDIGFMSGSAWWILILGAAGLVVGVLRRLLHVEPEIPGLFDEIDERRIEPKFVARRVLVSFVSLVGGASVGPEAALAGMGGGLGTFTAERRALSAAGRSTATLAGMAGAFGGLFAAPMLSALMVVEAADPEGGRDKYSATWIPMLVASTLGFSVYFGLAGTTFVNVYEVPAYSVEAWHFLAAIPLGLLGAILAILLALAMKTVHNLGRALRSRPMLLSTIGGLLLGLIAVAYPLSRFSGASQLTTVLENSATFSAAMLATLVLAKILAVAISFGTGFYGGPIFPMIFIGGTAGVAVNAAIPEVPLGLAVLTLFAAVPGAGAAIPFTLTFLAALTLTLGSPTQAAPAALATAISYSVYKAVVPDRPKGAG